MDDGDDISGIANYRDISQESTIDQNLYFMQILCGFSSSTGVCGEYLINKFVSKY